MSTKQPTLPKHPDSMRLVELMTWVQENDPSFKGQSRTCIYTAVHGDLQQLSRKNGGPPLRVFGLGLRRFLKQRVENVVPDRTQWPAAEDAVRTLYQKMTPAQK